MMKSNAWAGLLAVAVLCCCTGMAQAMTVQPVIVDLQPAGRGMTATLTVENSSTADMPLELTVRPAVFDANGAKPTGTDTGEILIYPAQAIVPPGQTQNFRVQWVGDAALATSKHFYITVAQLPIKLPEGQTSIQVLYNFQVLTNVAAITGGPQLSIVHADIGKNAQGKAGVALDVRNGGNSYGYVSHYNLHVVIKDGAGKPLFDSTLNQQQLQLSLGFGIVPAGAVRHVLLQLDIPTGASTVQAELVDGETK